MDELGRGERVLLPQCVKPLVYTLTLTPDLDGFTFAGSLTIEIVVAAATKVITMHCQDINISTARINHMNASEILYDPKASTVDLHFPEELQPGCSLPDTKSLHIQYTGVLNSNMNGFYRSKYVDNEGVTQYMASTQFEALDARRALPCWDEPAMKAGR